MMTVNVVREEGGGGREGEEKKRQDSQQATHRIFIDKDLNSLS